MLENTFTERKNTFRENKVVWKNRRTGIMFILPWLIGFAIFSIYPIITSFYYSFTEYNILKPPQWIGLGNYIQLLNDDPLFWKSLYNTLYYAVFSLPLGMVVSLVLAMLLNTKIKGLAIYRTIFYMPTIVPAVASSILWMWLLDPQMGIINAALSYIGIKGPAWLVDPAWAKPALILMSLWGVGGSMVIYLAGLQDVPEELYESAELDGATWWPKIWHITLPMISPTIFFNLIMGLIGSFQYFTQAYIMTGGGPMDSTLFYSLHLFNNAFRYYHMGYASAMAWILFIIILAATLLVFKTSARWVYYGGTNQ
ncbi:carbohydrate ABC transporter permease [Mahella australiensis]|uniref:Carbohydrate ABC transporter membrane protein 1, CUT1 family n=1 Tax=Mahella australiensis (strain DSM 15567 / CIP 107919 / 50-1 BON) TaxID=697281 RepID=F3ZY15_MAHA5|nr:sugar ABC transporter permease [Mahella australiensis]AEE97711.1 carbohydrate ABC transporter membrane protein 1, CUT1 family [Mahella australiensis 50-1 BON]